MCYTCVTWGGTSASTAIPPAASAVLTILKYSNPSSAVEGLSKQFGAIRYTTAKMCFFGFLIDYYK